jgi:hypothetical protein
LYISGYKFTILVKLKSSLLRLYVRHHDLVDRYGIYVTQMTTDMFHFPVLSSFTLITVFVTRLTRRVSLVEQELPTLPGHLSAPPVLSEVRVTRSLVLCVCFLYKEYTLLQMGTYYQYIDMVISRRIWRYQRDNQNPYIEEEQTT